jgi:hypothetical protein
MSELYKDKAEFEECARIIKEELTLEQRTIAAAVVRALGEMGEPLMPDELKLFAKMLQPVIGEQ